MFFSLEISSQLVRSVVLSIVGTACVYTYAQLNSSRLLPAYLYLFSIFLL